MSKENNYYSIEQQQTVPTGEGDASEEQMRQWTLTKLCAPHG